MCRVRLPVQQPSDVADNQLQVVDLHHVRVRLDVVEERQLGGVLDVAVTRERLVRVAHIATQQDGVVVHEAERFDDITEVWPLPPLLHAMSHALDEDRMDGHGGKIVLHLVVEGDRDPACRCLHRHVTHLDEHLYVPDSDVIDLQQRKVPDIDLIDLQKITG